MSSAAPPSPRPQTARTRLATAPPVPQEAVDATKAQLLFSQDLTTPYCWVCDRQDETVRRVRYPIVVGLGLAVLRRAFDGMWCHQHARQRRFVAAAITALFGWWALPLGLIATPRALMVLSRGGRKDVGENVALQSQMAAIKRQAGDAAGEARCWEAVLEIDPTDVGAAERLVALYGTNRVARNARHGDASPVLRALLVAVAVAVAIGTVVELTATLPETLWSWFSVVDTTGEYALFSAWRVAWVFAGGLALGEVARRTVWDARAPSIAWAIALGGILAALAVLAQAAVQHALWFLKLLRYGYRLTSLGLAVPATGSLFLYGGLGEAIREIASSWLLDSLRVGSWGLAAAFNGASAIGTAIGIARWQRQLGEIETRATARPSEGSARAWAATALVGLALGLAVALLPHQAATDRQRALQLAERGYEWLGQGRPIESVAAFEDSLALAPRLAPTHLGLGLAWGQADDVDRAIKAYRTAVQCDPEWIDAVRTLGWAHYFQGDIDRAEGMFRKALALSPGDGDATLGIGRIHLARREYAQAQDVLGIALDAGANPAETHMAMGQVLLALHKPLAAIENLRWALEYSPDDVACHYYLADAFSQAAQYAEALAEAEFLSQVPSLECLGTSMMALCQVDLGEDTLASATIERAIAAYRGGSLESEYVGVGLALLERHERAIHWLGQAIEQGSNNPHVHALLAISHAKLGAIERAWGVCESLAVRGERATYHATRADIHGLLGDWEGVLGSAEKALAIDPEHADALVSRSSALLMLGRPSRALKAALAARVVNPYYPTAYDLAARAYLALGETRDAEREAKRALQLLPRMDAPHYVLGECYAQRGQLDRARDQFEAFLARADDRPSIRTYKAEAKAYLASLD